MDLRDWLIEHNETLSGFAARCAVTHATISRIVNRRARPGGELQRKIYELTNGEVTPADFSWSEGGNDLPRFPRSAVPEPVG